MDDFDTGSYFDGSDYTFDDSNVGSVGDELWGSSGTGGDDYSYLDGLDQYGNGPSGGGDSLLGGESDSGISSSLGSTTAGLGGFNWSSLINPALGAISGYAQMEGKEKLNKEDWKARTEYMRAQLAEQEKYYQLHGKQLSDAYQKFSQFATPAGTNRPFAGLGQMQAPTVGVPPNSQMQTPPPNGLLTYGY